MSYPRPGVYSSHAKDRLPAIRKMKATVGKIGLFALRPKAKDVWTFALPKDKGRKQTKTVRRVYCRSGFSEWIAAECRWKRYRYPVVEFVRMSKGRYTILRVKNLMKYGSRIGRLEEIDYNYHSGAAVKRLLERQNDKSRRPIYTRA